MHTEFPFGSGTCVHTEEPVPRTPPAPLQRKHVLLRRAPLSGSAPPLASLAGEAQVVITPGVCVTSPELTQPFHRHGLIRAPGSRQGGPACTSHRLQRRLLRPTFPPRATHSEGASRTLAHVILPQSRKAAMSPRYAGLLS